MQISMLGAYKRLRNEYKKNLFLFVSPDYYIKGMKVTTDEKSTRGITSTWVFHPPVGFRCRQLGG